MAKSLDLLNILPTRFRDKTIDSLISNLFNRHLSKSDTVPLFGFVGDQLNLAPGEVQISESDLERQINQLTPFIYAEHASEKLTFSWADIVQKLQTLGVDYKSIDTWLSSNSYNFAPPIDLDKFCNYQEYFWVGKWIVENNTIDLGSLGIPLSSSSGTIDQFTFLRGYQSLFNNWNNSLLDPEYYVIERGTQTNGVPDSPQPTFPTNTWSDWSHTNLWVHRNDVISFIQSSNGLVNFSNIIQATRPIIEYSSLIGLNVSTTNIINEPHIPNDPIVVPVDVLPKKSFKNQLPLFDLYHFDNTHASVASSIFYYIEGQEFPIDPVIGRRIAIDSNKDYKFGHSLVNESDGSLFFYKLYDKIYPNQAHFQTIWRIGDSVGPTYSKFDSSGNIINHDMFVNFKNYFWVGLDSINSPSYNTTGLPEYYVIEKPLTGSGNSDWSLFNNWQHISTLSRSDISKYHQATKPIIEFNNSLELELLEPKINFNQLPRFKHYIDVNGSLTDNILNDAYAQKHLLARLSDLDVGLKNTIESNPEILNSCFDYLGEKYIQGLFSGSYYNIDNSLNYYGYKAKLTSFVGKGISQLNIIPIPAVSSLDLIRGRYYIISSIGDSDWVSCGASANKIGIIFQARRFAEGMGFAEIHSNPELITLTFNGDSFDLNSTTGGLGGNLGIGSLAEYGGISFQVSGSGYVIGDKFTIAVTSFIFQQKQLYVKIENSFRTLLNPSDIINEVQNTKIVPANPINQDGIWTVPPQMEWNISNETRSVISEGDLYYHFISIINAQPGLIGSSSGDNNWRSITKNVGLGGKIKQYDGDISLLFSTLIQQGISTSSLIDFAKESYQSLSTSINQFVEDVIPDILSNGKISLPFLPESGDTIDSVIVETFKTYFGAQNSVVLSSVSKIDDVVSSPFYDSTSSLFNLIVTLPYIGLCNKVLPKKYYDQDLNLNMLMHHDGHSTELKSKQIDISKKIVQKIFTRSQGQETPGIISGNYPTKPFAGQYWFQTTTSKLFLFNALSDEGLLPNNSIDGSLSFNRVTNEVWQCNNPTNLLSNWVLLGSDLVTSQIPWVEVKLDLLVQNLELAIETELYNKCPILNQVLDTVVLQSDIKYNSLMKTEFEKFGVKYGAVDVYASSFVQGDAFTWNYTNPTGIATWQDLYFSVYGTSRPDLYPWIGTLYLNEASLLIDLFTNGLIPYGSTNFLPSMWASSAEFIRLARINAGRTSLLSVDISTGILLPPFDQNSNESLLSNIPLSASDPFLFDDNSPIERYWKKTLDFFYAQQKTYFKIDPLTYVRETWGVKTQNVLNGEYTLNTQLGRKENNKDLILHNTSLTEFAKSSWIDATKTGISPIEDITYEFTCVSRKDGIFKVVVKDLTNAHLLGPAGVASQLPHDPTESNPYFFSINSTYVDVFLNVSLKPDRRGFFYGDSFTVNFIKNSITNPLDFPTVTVNPQLYFKAEGFNQIFTQYGRIYGEDSQRSINSSLLNNWIIKLGYRFSGMVNTDNIKINSQNTPIDSSAYSISVKENQFYNSSWINGLRIQLVNRGSTVLSRGVNVPSIGPNGTPGEDWVFRIDNFNSNRTSISWFNFDQAGESHTFIALDGQSTLFNWNRYKSTTSIQSQNSPFLVTGIQNFLNFIFGYFDKLDSDGWRFNDVNDPKTDSNNRQLGALLLIEQFINQQFSGVVAGSAFVFNPFYRKVWYDTPHGIVSGINNILGFENETICTVLDQNNKQIPKNNIRVFRQDSLTELVFDTPVYTLHLLTSEFEHIVLLENYSTKTLLLYDAFLGQRTTRLFFEGQKQANFNGRLDFGGHFLLGNKMKKNIESSISGINKLYDNDTSEVDSNSVDMARGLLGYQKKSYFANRGSTDNTQFRFWQGMIANKGTNFSIDAFVNAASYQDARLDEYWAYKISEYGDSKSILKSEMIVQPDDCIGEFANYVFLEADDKLSQTNDIANYFDEVPFDVGGFGSSSTIDTTGLIQINPNDESRWFSFSDLNQLSYLEADIIAEVNLTATAIDNCYVIKDSLGNPVIADCFEIHNINQSITKAGSFITGTTYTIIKHDGTPFVDIGAPNNLEGTIFIATGPGTGNGTALITYTKFREAGDYIEGTFNPPQFTYPRFTSVNSSTIKIIDNTLIGIPLKVIAFGPASKQYSPNLLYNYIDNTLVKNDIIWWDPARGIHHPRAVASIDIDSSKDDAIYTNSINQYKNSNLNTLKPWGSSQVGKIWWNTKDLYWTPYSDVKEFNVFEDRLAKWGSISDMSSIEVYEWIKSSTTPDKAPTGYSLNGEPAISYYVERNRTWWQRPIAWKYSQNPSINQRTFLTYQPQRLKIVLGTIDKLILKNGSFSSFGISKNSKISAVNYSSANKTDNTIQNIFGLAKVLSNSTTIGTSTGYNDGAFFPISTYFDNFIVVLNENSLTYRTNYLGQYTIGSFIDSLGNNQLVMTHVNSGVSQNLQISDISGIIGNQVTFDFDKLGIKISADSMNSISTISMINSAFTSNLIEIYLRDSVDVLVQIDFNDGVTSYNELLSIFDTSSTLGWIAWNDPITNPNIGIKPPLNLYEPIAGNWSLVGNHLHDVSLDITQKTSDPWSWFDGKDFTPYKSSWNEWKELKSDIKENRYFLNATDTYSGFSEFFTYPNLSESFLINNSSIFINEKKLKSDQWNVIQYSGISGSIIGGSNYSDGNYFNVPLIGGYSNGAIANITVLAGQVQNVDILTSVSGYLVGDVLSVLPEQIGSGITSGDIIDAGSGYIDGTYLNISLEGGKGKFATANITVLGGSVTNVIMNNLGIGYLLDDEVYALSIDFGNVGSGFKYKVLSVQTSLGFEFHINNVTPINGLSINIQESLLKQGDLVRVKINSYIPSKTELSFDPLINDQDPFKLTQYKLDYPYVTEILRDEFDNKSIINYYYWVKNKTSIGSPKKMSIDAISKLLSKHNGIYAIPQSIKLFNQLDGRPNRYSILSIRNLNQEVTGVDKFKLRLNKDHSLRDRDSNLSLKPIYTEWKLLRRDQLDRIPIELWNTLIDTLVGSTKIGQQLPYSTFEVYDSKNKSNIRYGLNDGQVMNDVKHAIATVKFTILNTKVNKYSNGILVQDFINYKTNEYVVFDINLLDKYLGTPANIRKFMSDLWRYAKSSQINEIFFESLQDMATKTLEMDKFFKTSFISLSDIKTITVKN